jgi:hypothetical protein
MTLACSHPVPAFWLPPRRGLSLRATGIGPAGVRWQACGAASSGVPVGGSRGGHAGPASVPARDARMVAALAGIPLAGAAVARAGCWVRSGFGCGRVVRPTSALRHGARGAAAPKFRSQAFALVARVCDALGVGRLRSIYRDVSKIYPAVWDSLDPSILLYQGRGRSALSPGHRNPGRRCSGRQGFPVTIRRVRLWLTVF